MKKINILPFVVISMYASVLTVAAQTNAVTSAPTAISELPASKDALWSYAISIVSPVLVWALAKVIPVIPKPLLPVLTPLIGLGIGFALNAIAGAHLGWIDMAKAGAIAVFIRETVNQMVTKQINGEQPWKQPAGEPSNDKPTA